MRLHEESNERGSRVRRLLHMGVEYAASHLIPLIVEMLGVIHEHARLVRARSVNSASDVTSKFVFTS